MYIFCNNCNATILEKAQACSACFAPNAIVVFSKQAKYASEGLGGLLTIIQVEGQFTKFIGKCVGGIFALDQHGALLWRQDWGYISSFEIIHLEARINGILVNLDVTSI